MRFEWDAGKAAGNLAKHGISFNQAATVFGDPLSVSYNDPDHSLVENRFVTIGLSRQGDLLVVAHADRGETVRIISARKATRSEIKLYEDEEN